MNKIIPFDSFNQATFTHPSFLYSKEFNCIKVDEHYLFLESGDVIKAGDVRLNEFLGFDLTNLIPKTVSDWTHLGVDAISGALDAFGGPVGMGASYVIDMLHAVAYLIEGFADRANSTSLWIGGTITALFAHFPVLGNMASGMIKGTMRLVGVGGGKLCRYLLKFFPKVGIPAFVSFLKSRGKAIVAKIVTTFAKMGESKLGKMLMKVPSVQKIIKFAKGEGLGKAFSSATTHMTGDLAVYSRTLVNESEDLIRASYKQLDPSVRQVLTLGEYVTLHGHMLQNEITGVAHHIDISKASAKELQQIESSLSKFFSRSVSPLDALKASVGRNLKTINENYLKTLKASAPKAGKEALSGWKRLFPKRLVEIAEKDTASLGSGLLVWVLKSIVKRVLRVVGRIGRVLAKTGISNTLNPNNNADSTTATTSTATEPVASTDAKPTEVGADAKKEPATTVSGLRMQTVENKAELGDLTIAFKTPTKDNTEGMLVLSGEIYDGEQDLSRKLSSYTDRDALLVDLKLVLNKPDKERVRDGEMAKWELSSPLYTPFVKEDSARYQFCFMVRERSKISLAKKRINEKFDWETILTPETIKAGFYKFSNSLYVKILKKDK